MELYSPPIAKAQYQNTLRCMTQYYALKMDGPGVDVLTFFLQQFELATA